MGERLHKEEVNGKLPGIKRGATSWHVLTHMNARGVGLSTAVSTANIFARIATRNLGDRRCFMLIAPGGLMRRG
jgi:predicted acyltransferase